jgi:hypothetical protein
MTKDELQGFHPLDPGRIHADDPVERRYWCRVLECSDDELAAALDVVGEHVSAVRAHLAARGRGPRAPGSSGV